MVVPVVEGCLGPKPVSLHDCPLSKDITTARGTGTLKLGPGERRIPKINIVFSREFWYLFCTNTVSGSRMPEGGPMKRSVLVRNSDATYREMLLEKRAQVVSGLGTKFDTLARMGRVAEDDQAQILNDESVSLHLNVLDYAQLRLIEEAIDRLDSGDYGICLSCDEPIPPKRLLAVSWARFCVRCQEAGAERGWHEAGSRVPVAARQ